MGYLQLEGLNVRGAVSSVIRMLGLVGERFASVCKLSWERQDD